MGNHEPDVPAYRDGYRRYTTRAELHKSLTTLMGLINGIGADAYVAPAEAAELENWCSLHEPMLDWHPFNELIPLLRSAIADSVLMEEELLDILWLCERLTDETEDRLFYDLTTASIQNLQGVLYGVLADGELNNSEIKALQIWIQSNEYLIGTYPFDEIQSLVASVLADGKITEAERDELKAFFSVFVDPRESVTLHQPELERLREEYSVAGICALAPEIEFDGKRFCITGAFSSGHERPEIAAIIESRGGRCTKGVSGITDYLIVGGDGNPCWAYACYGRKIEKAMNLRRSGGAITIVNEVDFWDALND